MRTVLGFVSIYLAGVPDWVRKRKLLILLLHAVVTAVLLHGMTKLRFDFTIERWLQQDDTAFAAYNDFHEQFGSDDGIVIMYRPKDGNVFSAPSLRAVKSLRDDLVNYYVKLKPGETSALSHVVKVDALINAPVLTVKDDVMVSHWLVGASVPTARGALDEIRRTALGERDFPLKYFSKDEKYGAIYIKTDFGAIPLDAAAQAPSTGTVDMAVGGKKAAAAGGDDGVLRFKPTDMADYVALNAALGEILKKPAIAGELEFYKTGNTIDSENQVKMGKEMGLLYGVGLLVMLGTLFFIFRSFAGMAWPALIVVLSTLWTFGIAGFAGLSISPFVVLTILLTLTIGMADVTHMMSAYLYLRAEGHDSATSMREAYGKSGLACFLTTITTVASMLSLLSGSLVPVINFSLMSAIGVLMVFFLTVHLLPALLDIWSPAANPAQRRGTIGRLVERIVPDLTPLLQRGLDRIVPAVEKRPFAFIAPFIAAFALSLYGAWHVKVDYSVYDQYAKDSNFYQSIKLLDDKMAGSAQMSLYVDLGEDNGFQDPAVLHVVDDLQHKLEKDYAKYVVTTSSIVNVVKDAYQKQNDGRADMYRIPERRDVLSQTLFTFNIADPDERERLISENYRKANITVTLRGYGSNEYTKVFEGMKKDINDSVGVIRKTYPEATVSITGLFAMGMKAADYLVMNELQSFGLSLLVVSLMLLVIFNSFKAGLISLVPNIVPSFMVLGILGLLRIPLDFYTMMLAPIAVGIAVDDTIHFVSVYRTEVIKDGDIRRALVDTVRECGQSVVFASMILGFGFGIMAIATTPGLASLGRLGFLAIFSGLVCELFLTPALILAFRLRFPRKDNLLPQAAPPHALAVPEGERR
jgi:hypothetical protein